MPDCCIICNKEGSCLCEGCKEVVLRFKKTACVICNKIQDTATVCQGCKTKTKLDGAFVTYRYEGVIKQLLYQFKYNGTRSIGRYLADQLQVDKIDQFDIVSYVPSDGATRRVRGFNPAEVIAKKFGKKQNLRVRELLLRTKHVRQVGLSRQNRLKEVQNNFMALPARCKDKNVLLVDDVVTTGATISECAKELKRAGAKSVWAIAVAKK